MNNKISNYIFSVFYPVNILISLGIFAIYTGLLAAILLVIAVPVYLISRRFIKMKTLEGMSPYRSEFDKGHLFLILLPLTPVIQYALANQDILTIATTAQFIGAFAIISALILIAVPLIFRQIAPPLSLIAPSCGLLYLLIAMAQLSLDNSWHNCTPSAQVGQLVAHC